RRFFAAFAVFGKLHISCAGLCAFAPGKVRFLTSCLGSAENRSEARARSRKRRVFWAKISGFPDPPLVKGFYCAMVVLLAGLLTGKRCGFSSQRSSGGGGPAPFRRDDAEKVGKIRKFPGPMIKRWRDQGAGMDCG